MPKHSIVDDRAVKEPLDLDSLFPEITEIRDALLRDKVREIWERAWSISEYVRLADVPISVSIAGSQLKHCQGIVKGALALARVWEEVHGVELDRDIIIAAALLMDVSKLIEIRPVGDGKHERTELGRALPHALVVASWALASGLPLQIVHIVSCHSPNGGKAPNSMEAHLLDAIDQADLNACGFDIWERKVTHYQR